VSRANVLYLARTWGVGGAQTLIGLLLRHLPRSDFNVVVAPYDAGEEAEAEFLAFLQRRAIETSADRVPWRGLSSLPAARRRIRELVERHRIDLVHTHDNLSNALVALDRRRLPCACVASAYGWFEPRRSVRVPSGEGWFGPGWRQKILLYYWLDLNFSLPRFDFVYTVSEDMKRKLLRGRTAEERIRVIHTGLAPGSVESALTAGDARERLGLPRGAFVVGVVARLSGEKGHLVLLSAIARMTGAPDAHLLVVGTGYMQPILARRAQELGLEGRVHIPGYVDDLPAALKAMDVCVLPSILDEGFPTVLLEAQMAGLPVIGADIGGMRETMLPGVTGLLARSGDPDDLASALEQLRSDPALRASMSAAARPWVEQTFPLSAMMDGVSRMYADALAQGPGRRKF
jgi:glycosyltransferase involved in cell wall biosynthesis